MDEGPAVSTDLGFPIERARTLLEMGHRLGDAALVDETTQVFAQTGARVHLAFALHARAGMGTNVRNWIHLNYWASGKRGANHLV